MKINDVKELLSHWAKNIFKYFVYALILGITLLVLFWSILFISNIENKKFVTRYSKRSLELGDGVFSLKFIEGWTFKNYMKSLNWDVHTVSVKLKVSKSRWKKVSSNWQVKPDEILFLDEDGFLVTNHDFFHNNNGQWYLDFEDDSTMVHSTQWDYFNEINYKNYRKIKSVRYSLDSIGE